MATPPSKFAAFDRLDCVYGTVSGHALETSIFVPKSVIGKTKKCPVLVHLHGGGFVVGHRLHEDWYALWSIQLALEVGAVIISPDYRLLPEATVLDTLQDIHSFWRWLYRDLEAELSSRSAVKVDVSRLALHGESSGAWLAAQSYLRHPQLVRPQVVLLTCGSLDTSIADFNIPRPRSILGAAPIPAREAETTVRQYKRGIRTGAVRTATEPAELWNLLMCMVQQGHYGRFFRDTREERIDMMKALGSAEDFPPTWVLHGENDSLAPVQCSTNFVKKLRETNPDAPVRLTLLPGDHSFDHMKSIDELGIRDGCGFVRQHWQPADV